MVAMVDIKRGDTFRLYGRLASKSSDGQLTPIDISGYSIRSQIRDRSGNLTESLVVSIHDAVNGIYSVFAPHTNTTLWQKGVHEMDIEFTTSMGGVVVSTQTIRVNVIGDVTI